MAKNETLKDYFGEDPMAAIRSGNMGPENTMGYFNKLREATGSLRTGTAGYLSNATRGAGFVPKDLAGRLGAMKSVGEGKIAANLAASMSQSQTNRAMGAMDRYYRDYQFQEQLSSQESSMWGSLFGGIGSSVISLFDLGRGDK